VIRIAAPAIALALAGCAAGPTPKQIAAADDATCRSYGTTPGTDNYLACRMHLNQLHLTADIAEAQRSQALANSIGETLDSMKIRN